jgi:metal-dependent amidase/aminoacylase/carboxypeptidase family protein
VIIELGFSPDQNRRSTTGRRTEFWRRTAAWGLHHPEFALDEDALALGAATLVRAAQRFLTGP